MLAFEFAQPEVRLCAGVDVSGRRSRQAIPWSAMFGSFGTVSRQDLVRGARRRLKRALTCWSPARSTTRLTPWSLVSRQHVLERGVVALDCGYRLIDEQANGRLPRLRLEMRPAGRRRRSSVPAGVPCHARPGAPSAAAFQTCIRSSWQPPGSPPTASRAGARGRTPTERPAPGLPVSTSSVFPWTPSSQ